MSHTNFAMDFSGSTTSNKSKTSQSDDSMQTNTTDSTNFKNSNKAFLLDIDENSDHHHHQNLSLALFSSSKNNKINLKKELRHHSIIPVERLKTVVFLVFFWFCIFLASFVAQLTNHFVEHDVHKIPPLRDYGFQFQNFLISKFVRNGSSTSNNAADNLKIKTGSIPEFLPAEIYHKSFEMAELCGMIIVFQWFFLLSIHKHRLIILRRFFFLSSVLYLYRCVTTLLTILPLPATYLRCAEKLEGDKLIIESISRAIDSLSKGAMSTAGVSTCGDYVYSGHTIVLMLPYLMLDRYVPNGEELDNLVDWWVYGDNNKFGSPKKKIQDYQQTAIDIDRNSPNNIKNLSITETNNRTKIYRQIKFLRKIWKIINLSICTIGILLIGFSREHYSIDILIAYFFISREFFNVHSILDDQKTKNLLIQAHTINKNTNKKSISKSKSNNNNFNENHLNHIRIVKPVGRFWFTKILLWSECGIQFSKRDQYLRFEFESPFRAFYVLVRDLRGSFVTRSFYGKRIVDY